MLPAIINQALDNTVKSRIMKKVLLAAMFALAGASFVSCGGSDDDVEKNEIGNTNKESVIALWQDLDNDPNNIVSFAKDGTYKIILQKSAYSFFFSTGRYSVSDGRISCKDNFVEGSSEEYTFSIDTNEILLFEGIAFKKVGVEENALENKLNGRDHKYGGYTMGGIGYTSGEANYYIKFTNDYTAYKVFEKIYYKEPSKNRSSQTLMHYVYFDNHLYLAEENKSYSPKYIVDFNDSNCFYYINEKSQKILP